MKTTSVYKIVAVIMFAILPLSITNKASATTSSAFTDSMSAGPAEVLSNSTFAAKVCFNIPYSMETAMNPPSEEVAEKLLSIHSQNIPYLAFQQEGTELYYFDRGEDTTTVCFYYFE